MPTPTPDAGSDLYGSPGFVKNAFENNEAKLAEARLETEFVLRCIDADRTLEKGAKILDCPCGRGHHAQILTKKGYDVTAIDRAKLLIAKARGQYPTVRFRDGTFADLAGENLVPDASQDAVFCLGESLGYEPTVEGNLAMLRNMYAKLKPGASLVLQWPSTPKYRSGSQIAEEKGEPHDVDSLRYFPPSAVTDFERRLPDDYDVPPEFRDLEIEMAVPLKNKEPDFAAATTQANYLKVQTDNTGRPIGAPILQALCKKIGGAEAQFMPPFLPDGEETYLCAMVIRKPMPVEIIRQDVLDTIEFWSGRN